MGEGHLVPGRSVENGRVFRSPACVFVNHLPAGCRVPAFRDRDASGGGTDFLQGQKIFREVVSGIPVSAECAERRWFGERLTSPASL